MCNVLGYIKATVDRQLQLTSIIKRLSLCATCYGYIGYVQNERHATDIINRERSLSFQTPLNVNRSDVATDTNC